MDLKNVIEVKNLWFSYNHNLVLKGVNLEIEKGEFVAVIGPNGGGKTTLLKIMLGLNKPQKGTINVLGSFPNKAIDRIGYVPQNVNENKTFPITVQDVVLLGRICPGKQRISFSSEDKKAVQVSLEKMGVWKHRYNRIGDLSGGERQRVFISRALVSEPEIILLDEPTASVDAKGQSELFEILKELNKSVTILVVSHDLMILSSYIKSVVCVNREVYFHNMPEITDKMIEKAYHCPVELIAHGLPHRVLHPH